MGIPKAIASYDGGEFKGRVKEILDAEGIDRIVMTTDLSFDCLTRTIKSMLYERVQHIRKGWHLLFSDVIKQYSNTIHDSTKLKPVDAIQDNAVEVKTNLTLRARFLKEKIQK